MTRAIWIGSTAMLTILLGLSLWQAALADKATPEILGGKERYLTAVSSDKPIYKPGENVYVRGVILEAATRKPLPQAEQAQASVEIKGPKGDTVSGGQSATQDSVWGFAWTIPQDMAGGEYTIKVTYPWNGHAPAERKFDIRSYRAPRLRSQIVFLRDGYGPGEKVQATLHTERSEGGIPEGAKVAVSARIDGAELQGNEASVDARGNCSVAFDLPLHIAKGEGTLALVIQDGGVVETASKTIPILLQTLDIQFYPEGGELVANLPNRVYFEARQPNGKPADVEGRIMSQPLEMEQSVAPKPVVEFRTEHEGRGLVEFHLNPKLRYFVQITKPAGIKKEFSLPAPKASGAVILLDKPTFTAKEAIGVRVGSHTHLLKVTLSQRERLLSETAFDRRAEDKVMPVRALQLDPKDASGVLRLTVWDEKGVPLAERLIYREPAKKLNVSMTPEKQFYTPGETVKLNLKTTDGEGKPISAVVGMTATDDSVLEMIEKREQSPRLPVMVLLEPEVKELADAHLYLDAGNPKAGVALDLLLGTQGWRRFAFMDATKFIAQHGDAARRVLALKIQARHELKRALAVADEKAGGFGNADAAIMAEAAPAAPQAAAAPAEDRGPMIPLEAPAVVAVAEFKQANGQEELQQAMAKAEGLAKDMKIADDIAMRGDVIVIREFAHQVRPGRKPTDRVDFAETLYWNAGVKTNDKGEASISFGLNDSVTTFRVFADGFSPEGALGAANIGLESVQPFYVEPKLPLEVTTGDTVLLPVNVINSLGSDLPGATVLADLGSRAADQRIPLAELPTANPFDLPALARLRQIIPLKIRSVGLNDFTLTAQAGPYLDKVTRKLSVKANGFPIEKASGGLLGPVDAGTKAESTATYSVTIPDGVVRGSISSNIAVYPTPLGNMTEALQRLIQDPNGCFEQTSSTAYPLVMAQQYFLSHTGVDAKIIQSAREKLDGAYKRLTGFETKEKGYEWFGGAPAHEALTAYGLLEFSDMAQVREVDSQMLERTRTWLMARRDGTGGFKRDAKAIDSFGGAPELTTNAYIVWALLEAGQKDLAKEISATVEKTSSANDSYLAALGANIAALAGDKARSSALMQKLVASQNKDGAVDGGKTSITCSGGEALTIETTALATLAWLRDPAFAGSVEKAMKFLADSCKNGRYGSTQSTVLALRAIVAYDKQRARPKAAGKVRVFVDGQGVGDWLAFDPKTEGAIKLPDVSELLTKGEHKIEVRMQDGGQMPYAIGVSYNALTPASSKECKLEIAIKLASVELAEGAATEANVTVTNKTKELVPTPVAVIGIPGGLEVRHDQLKELVKKGTIHAYEVIGREVVLYWRALPAEAKVEVPLSCIAAIPGTYTGPASRAYLYYTDEHKQWADGLKVAITPK